MLEKLHIHRWNNRVFILSNFVVVIKLLSCVWLCDPINCLTLGSPVLHYAWNSLKFMSIESVTLSNHLILCHHLLLLLLIFPSIRVCYKESALRLRGSKYWSFSISTSNEYSRLISFRINWFDLLAVQESVKSLL